MAVPLLWSCTPSPRSFIICTHRTTCSVFTVHYSPSVSVGLPHLLHEGGKEPEGYFSLRNQKKKKIVEAFTGHLEVKIHREPVSHLLNN